MNLGGAIHLNKAGLCLFAIFAFIFYLYATSSGNSTKSDLRNIIDLRKLLSVAIKAAQNGGDEVIAAKDNLEIGSKGKTKEGINDVVTIADFNSHCAMKATLHHFYPNVKVVSEEEKMVCKEKKEKEFSEPEGVRLDNLHEVWINIEDVTIWIDPLDATKEYTEKLYKYVTTMVCVAVKGEPIMGVIYNPFSKETSWAWVANGKSDNLKQIDANNKLRFIISISHSGEVRNLLEKKFINPEIISAAGAGYKVLEVAAGRADAYVHITAIKKWDICAGNAILRSLGGEMTTLKNLNVDYKDDTNPVNQDGLLATLKNHDLILEKLNG